MKKSIETLLKWSFGEYQYLPWRRSRTLYGTLVSEIMLQQTTVGTVVNKFDAFLERFPTLRELAQASEDEVQIEWKGLGYYRRARNLKKAAEFLVAHHGGQIPMDFDALVKIPGIGDYTANALLAIGFNRKALAIDANLERVFSRLYGLDEPKGPKLQKEIKRRFDLGELLPKTKSYREINEALMDLGRVYCQSRKAYCRRCPLNSWCVAFERGAVEKYPNQSQQKKEAKHELSLLRVFVKKDEKILGRIKSENEWLAGQVELPTYILATTDPSLKQYPFSPLNIEGGDGLLSFKTGITKYKIRNYVLSISEKEFRKKFNDHKNYEYFLQDKNVENLATSVLKVLDKLSF